jgi:hypothetical protein
VSGSVCRVVGGEGRAPSAGVGDLMAKVTSRSRTPRRFSSLGWLALSWERLSVVLGVGVDEGRHHDEEDDEGHEDPRLVLTVREGESPRFERGEECHCPKAVDDDLVLHRASSANKHKPNSSVARSNNIKIKMSLNYATESHSTL